jgi:phage gp16-like protein
MATHRNGMALAAREHLASGQPLTRLEAMILYGVANLPDVVAEMRRQGWLIKSRQTTYAAAMNRVRRYAELTPPKDLPVREIILTEYWLSK